MVAKLRPTTLLSRTTRARLPWPMHQLPPSGYIIAGGEIIYYAKRTATAFQTLERGLERTDARDIKNGAQVVLASIPITIQAITTTMASPDSTNEDDPTLVEWIAYNGRRPKTGAHHLLANFSYSTGNGIQSRPPATTVTVTSRWTRRLPRPAWHAGRSRARQESQSHPRVAHE